MEKKNNRELLVYPGDLDLIWGKLTDEVSLGQSLMATSCRSVRARSSSVRWLVACVGATGLSSRTQCSEFAKSSMLGSLDVSPIPQL